MRKTVDEKTANVLQGRHLSPQTTKQTNKQLYYSLNLIAVHKCTTNQGDWRSNWNLKILAFEDRRKTSRSKDENQQQTQPTCDWDRESNTGHIGGRRVLSLLHHPCPSTALAKQHPSNECRNSILMTWTTQILVVLLIGCAVREFSFNQSEALLTVKTHV